MALAASSLNAALSITFTLPHMPSCPMLQNSWHGISLTLADLGGEGEGILHALPDMARNFDTVSTRPRHERNLMAPYFTANRCDGVAEGQECFLIPGGGSRRELSRFCEVVRPQCDDGK